MKNFILVIKEFYATSKIVNVKYKKLRIFASAFLSNLIVGLDLLIILFFASFFTLSESSSVEYLSFIFKNEFLLPIFVLLRFVCVYLDTMNIHHFRLLVEKNLREDILKDIFKLGNYSISDSYFYINGFANSHRPQWVQKRSGSQCVTLCHTRKHCKLKEEAYGDYD